MDYQLNDGVALVTMDDGKANAVNPDFVRDLTQALDRAQAEARAVCLVGRAGRFSAGFDLRIVEAGGPPWESLYGDAARMLERLCAFPIPVVAACSGHAVGLGLFLVMVSDYRVAAEGDYTLSLPETRIGVDLSPALVALTEANLPPRLRRRMALLSMPIKPAEALAEGMLDEIVAPGHVVARATEIAATLGQLNAAQFARNKLITRRGTLEAIGASIAAGTM